MEGALGYLAELEELERTSAVERLERAIDARVGAVVHVRHIFFWEGLRPEARMDEMLAAVGL